MKTLLKLFIIILLIPTLFTVAVYAKEPQKPTSMILSKSEVVNKDYFAAGDMVTISGVVNGDAYVAGGTILVDGSINGDLLAAGGTITVRGPVKGNIRAMGGIITLASRVGGSITLGAGNISIADTASITGSMVAGAGNMEVFGPIGRGMTVGVGNLTMAGNVSGDVLAGTGQLTLVDNAVVKGNLTYWSDQEANIGKSATVSGSINRHVPPQTVQKPKEIKALTGKMVTALAVFAAAASVAMLVVIFLLGLAFFSLFPVFTTSTLEAMRKTPWKSFGVGLLTAIVVPVVGISAILTIVGIPVAVVLFVSLGVLYLFAHLFAALFIGEYVFTKLKRKPHHAWKLLTGLVVMGMFNLIPIIGWLAKTVMVFLSMGALVSQKLATYQEMRRKNLI